jgi:hypothetical protein
MRVIDKTVQMNENFKPVMLITLELPLMLEDFSMLRPNNASFMMEFYEAIKTYEDNLSKEKNNE